MRDLTIERSSGSIFLRVLVHLFWIAVFLMSASILAGYSSASNLAAETDGYYSLGTHRYASDGPNVFSIGWWACILAAGGIFLNLVIGKFAEEGGFDKSGEGRWNSVTESQRGIFGLTEGTYAFDEITDIWVSQSVFERMFGIGKITVTMVKYLGPEIESFTSEFNGVRFPHGIKAAIMASAPPSKGLSLHLTHASANAADTDKD